jgi:hypothetical protein
MTHFYIILSFSHSLRRMGARGNLLSPCQGVCIGRGDRGFYQSKAFQAIGVPSTTWDAEITSFDISRITFYHPDA